MTWLPYSRRIGAVEIEALYGVSACCGKTPGRLESAADVRRTLRVPKAALLAYVLDTPQNSEPPTRRRERRLEGAFPGLGSSLSCVLRRCVFLGDLWSE